MIEVCSTKLPQLAIPMIMGDARYQEYRRDLNNKIGIRSQIISDILGTVPELKFNTTSGSFYNTIIFKEGVLKANQRIGISCPEIQALVDTWLASEKTDLDARFVYYLLAGKGVCVVPVSSFCSELYGFRVTLLEEDEGILEETFTRIRDGVEEYVHS